MGPCHPSQYGGCCCRDVKKVWRALDVNQRAQQRFRLDGELCLLMAKRLATDAAERFSNRMDVTGCICDVQGWGVSRMAVSWKER